MVSLCRSCGERPAVTRRVCRRCDRAIALGRKPDVRTPATRGPSHAAVRSTEATEARIKRTLAKYPHLKREP